MINGLEALRAKAGVQDKADTITQTRADFALIWKAERYYLNADEHATAKEFAGQYIRNLTHNQKAMREIGEMLKNMADAMRRDTERSERIRAERRAERERAAA